MDIGDAEKQLKKADGFLTTLENVLKKHWGIILILIFCGFIYWALNLPPVEPVYIEDQQYIDTTQYYEEDPAQYYQLEPPVE